MSLDSSINITAASPITAQELMAALPFEFEEVRPGAAAWRAPVSAAGGYSIFVSELTSHGLPGVDASLAVDVEQDDLAASALIAKWLDASRMLIPLIGGHGFMLFPNWAFESGVYWSPETLYIPHLDPCWEEYADAVMAPWTESVRRVGFVYGDFATHPWFGEGERPPLPKNQNSK